jgi:hypothetical protein
MRYMLFGFLAAISLFFTMPQPASAQVYSSFGCTIMIIECYNTSPYQSYPYPYQNQTNQSRYSNLPNIYPNTYRNYPNTVNRLPNVTLPYQSYQSPYSFPTMVNTMIGYQPNWPQHSNYSNYPNYYPGPSYQHPPYASQFCICYDIPQPIGGFSSYGSPFGYPSY